MNPDKNPELKKTFIDIKKEAEVILNDILAKDELNSWALYGKSLLLFNQGKVEESADILKKTLDAGSSIIQKKAKRLRQRVIDLLQPEKPIKIEILEQLKKVNKQIFWKFLIIIFFFSALF